MFLDLLLININLKKESKIKMKKTKKLLQKEIEKSIKRNELLERMCKRRRK